MEDWIRRIFIERADLFLKIMNERWPGAEALVDGMIRLLKDFGVEGGRILDLCCGNGRVAISFAKKGFTAVGVDLSPMFIEDAKARARELGVSKRTSFICGDARKLLSLIPKDACFDVVTSVWTSIGYYGKSEDLAVFKQARQLTRDGGILFIAETAHRDSLSLRLCPSSFTIHEDTVLVEDTRWDALTSRLRTTWSFYAKNGDDLKFIDRIAFEIYIYSVSELASMLIEAGWETVATYGNLATRQPFGPWTDLNLVAKTI
ncbi:MAG: class I SAM-dependent methyltransferase [Candidatus Brockarchaeota archaeon]|nr:class I SAM-dependent methyltransferase [Candidatus Brockarchaeota archaeon]